MILALVPLTMYVVRYELAHGRPYSKFEELLLHAVNAPPREGGCTFADLRAVFGVHPRLLTEGLATLIQEGWAAMEQSGEEIRYLVTEDGRRTIASGRRPSNVRVRTKHATIVRERLTGQLARASDLGVVTARNIRGNGGGQRKVWKEALRPRLMRSQINGGEAERLLPRADEQQEWIRWIDSVTRVSQDLHYLPVQVDIGKGRVLGLPYQWQHLVPDIVQEIQERSEEYLGDTEFQNEIRELMRASAARNRSSGEEKTTDAATAFALVDSASCTDVALTAQESRDMTEQALAKCDSHALLVVSQLDQDRAAAVRDTLIRLNANGVQADLLWSCDESAAEPKAIYNILSAARARANARSALTFNSAPSGISADLLLAATSEGPVAVLGPAFAAQTLDDRALAVAARLSDLTVLAALARLCAGWWEAVAGEQGMLPAHRWKHLAECWADEGALPAAQAPDAAGTKYPCHQPGACSGTITLITGPRQGIVRREMAAEPGTRFLLADGSLAIDAVRAEFSNTRPDTAGYLYQAFGGTDGWSFLRRQRPGTWAEHRKANYPPPSPTQQVAAGPNRWLISSNSSEFKAALSVQLTGHIAAKAWERTADLARTRTDG